jgi:hypothetical protein
MIRTYELIPWPLLATNVKKQKQAEQDQEL